MDLTRDATLENGGTEKLVLAAEDNEERRTIYSTILRHHGYRVEPATTGDAALRMARARGPDAMILDTSLPGIDGWTVAARLAEEPAPRDLPILAVTALVLPDDRRGATELGRAGFLVTPIRPRHVLEGVRRLMRGGPDRPTADGP